VCKGIETIASLYFLFQDIKGSEGREHQLLCSLLIDAGAHWPFGPNVHFHVVLFSWRTYKLPVARTSYRLYFSSLWDAHYHS